MKTRRDFIKISALGTGGIAMAGAYNWTKGSGLMQEVPVEDAGKNLKLLRYPTYCEVCFWKCAGWTYTNEEGKIVKIIGNDDDPHSNGRMCPRGTGGIGMYHDEDRLKTPLIRTTENGQQTFREASWDEALDLIAQKYQGIKQKYGAETIAGFFHGSPGSHLGHLLHAFGSHTEAHPSYAQCRGPREVAFAATYGSGVGSPEPTDIRDTKCLVLIGSHIGENMHNGQVQEMADAIDNGATIITVDPRFSTAASKSKFWLPIKPSTDLALLLAWINVIINDELYDKDFVEKYTYGFDELKEHVSKMTPEWAYGITTLEPALVRKTAYEMAAAAPSVIVHPGRHVTWYGDDTQRERAIAILNGLLGSWGHRGGFYFPEAKSLPSFPTPATPHPEWDWKDIHDEKYPLALLPVSNALVEASIPENNPKHLIKSWLVAGTNLPLTLPDQEQTLKAMQAIEFLVVVDTMPMEITGYADVVLPECTYLERYDDIRSAPHREPNIALRMPATQPKYDSKPAWWIAKQLGEKLGLQKYFPWKDIEEMLDWQLKQVGSSLEEMQRIGVKKFDRVFGAPYLADGEDFEFNTNSGKIELYSTEMQNAGFDPLPSFTKHEEPPQGYYRLIYGRTPAHTFSRTANNPNLVDLKPEPWLWINPKVATIWGIENGQYIWLKNQDGKTTRFPIQVRVTERIRWDSIFMPHGFGHHNKRLSRAYGKGASDAELITNVKIDPVMGGTGMRSNFVTFLTEEPEMEVES
jgi:thiosulfate reductase/polysulfide reductase chain A